MVGGSLINYPGDVSTPTAGTTTAKLVINSTISTDDTRYMCTDIKNCYLRTPMERYKYMQLKLKIIPQEIIEAYKLNNIAQEGYVYIEI